MNSTTVKITDFQPFDTPLSVTRIWAGRAISALAVLFLLFDGVMKLLKPVPVVESFERLGYPDDVSIGLGILQLACLALYVVPRTATLGAVLITGYLGGAISTHLRIGDPWLSHTLFPIYVGAVVWLGLYLRDGRLQRLLFSPKTTV